MTNKLEQLRNYSVVVADTGDLDAIRKYQPVDATTNPSLLLKALAAESYRPLFTEAIHFAKKQSLAADEEVRVAAAYLAARTGKEILQLVPGVVSTEVDARLSFDTRRTLENARQLIRYYEMLGIDRKRILIKIAATWEGIAAAAVLEREGITCNLTLLFGFEQAVACADAGAHLISPFVGRILDWYINNTQAKTFLPDDEPGVISVRSIYHYYKQHCYNTVVMAASFRNVGEIEALAGCDKLTISPALLETLASDSNPLPRKLDATCNWGSERVTFDEPAFRYGMNSNAMATEKLADGIRLFAADQVKLEEQIKTIAKTIS